MHIDVPTQYKINDKRTIKELSDQTFSNFKKTEVLKSLEKAIISGSIEESCYWKCELVISNQYTSLWNKIFSIYLRYINTENPELIDKLFLRYVFFLKISDNYKKVNELRNNQNIRHYFTEIICILCKSKKNKMLSFKKIGKDQMNTKYISTKFRANKDLIYNIFLENDPQELRIIFNEFYYSLKSNDFEDTIFWLQWCLEWDRLYKKRKQKVIISRRHIKGIDNKYCNDLVWIFWEIILDYNKTLKVEYFSKKINFLYTLFKLNYKILNNNSNLWFMVISIKLLTKSFNIDTLIVDNYKELIQSTGNINKMYYQFKKLETNDNKNYYNNLDKLKIDIIETNIKPKKDIINIKKNNIKQKEIPNKSLIKLNKLLEIDNLMITNISKKENIIKDSNVVTKQQNCINNNTQSVIDDIQNIIDSN